MSRVGRGKKRFQARGFGGQFRRNTLANTFGFKLLVCPKCRICNTYKVGEEPPEKCQDCGSPLGVETKT